MYVVEFKPNTDIYPKCMVLTDPVTGQEAWDRAVKDYGESVDKVHKLNELNRTVALVRYGTPVIYSKIIKTDKLGKVVTEPQEYPIINK